MNLRRKILPFILPLVGALAVTSCVYDDFEPANGNEYKPHSGKLTVTMRVRTLGSAGSRADGDGWFLDGDHDEHSIGKNGNFAIFFNEDSTFFSLNQLLMSEEETPDKNIIETVYKTTLDPDDFDRLPKYCLVLLNAPYYYELFTNPEECKTIKDVLKKEWQAPDDPRYIGVTDDGYFVMSNSIYYNDKNELQTVCTLRENMIVDPTDPRSVANAEVLTVYVERMAAKFTLEVPFTLGADGYLFEDPDAEPIVFFSGFNNGTPKYTSAKWQILVTGWGVNAYETSTNVFKKLTKGKNYFYGMTEWPGWKDPGAFRTYWSEDPHYEGTYPSQYRRADNTLPGDTIKYYEKFETDGLNKLKNYSFDDLRLGDISTFGRPIYSPENTYDYNQIYSKLGTRTDLLAGTHVLLGARILCQGKNGGEIKARDLWRDRDGFYYETELECLQALLHSFANSLNSQEYMRYDYYQWGKGGIMDKDAAADYRLNGQTLYAYTAGFSGDYEYKLYLNGQELNEETIASLYKKDMMPIATIELGDGRRLPWPKEGKLDICHLVKNKDGEVIDTIRPVIKRMNDSTGLYVNVRNTLNQDDIKSLMFEWLGSVDHFQDGRMYYAVPARILRGSGNKVDICGVVRNAWYQFNLLSMRSFGTPVDDRTQPIVPSPTANNDQINVTINILGWHGFNSWIDGLPKVP